MSRSHAGLRGSGGASVPANSMKLVARTRPAMGVTTMLGVGIEDGGIDQRRRARHLHVVATRRLERHLEAERREQRRRPDAGAHDSRCRTTIGPASVDDLECRRRAARSARTFAAQERWRRAPRPRSRMRAPLRADRAHARTSESTGRRRWRRARHCAPRLRSSAGAGCVGTSSFSMARACVARATGDVAVQPHFVVTVLADQIRPARSRAAVRSAPERRAARRARDARVFAARRKAARAKRAAQGAKCSEPPRRDVEHAAERKQLAPESEQQCGRGQRFDQFGGDMPGIAETRAGFARRRAIDEQYVPALRAPARRQSRCR